MVNRLRRIDIRTTLICIAFGYEPVDRNIHLSRIADVRSTIRESNLETLSKKVDAFRRAKSESGDVITFEKIQNLENVQTTGAKR